MQIWERTKKEVKMRNPLGAGLLLLLGLSTSADELHDFLGLNEPFFNPNAENIFTAQVRAGMSVLARLTRLVCWSHVPCL